MTEPMVLHVDRMETPIGELSSSLKSQVSGCA
jgi:hypothetical protein